MAKARMPRYYPTAKKKRRIPLLYEGSVLRAPDLTESQKNFLKAYGFELPTKVRVVKRTISSAIELWSWTKSKGQELLPVDQQLLARAVKDWQDGLHGPISAESGAAEANTR
jgi:hypothetical protein